MMNALALRRRLFGYSPDDVAKLMADREQMFVQANHRAGAAEGQLAELRASFQPLIEESGRKDQQIASLQGQIGELAGRLEAMEEQAVELDELRQQLAEMRNDPISQLVSGDVTFKFLVTEVAPVIKAAEESAAAML